MRQGRRGAGASLAAALLLACGGGTDAGESSVAGRSYSGTAAVSSHSDTAATQEANARCLDDASTIAGLITVRFAADGGAEIGTVDDGTFGGSWEQTALRVAVEITDPLFISVARNVQFEPIVYSLDVPPDASSISGSGTLRMHHSLDHTDPTLAYTCEASYQVTATQQ